MTLLKFNHRLDPFVPATFDKLVSDLLSETAPARREVSYVPAADIVENEQAWEFHIALPGVSREQISVTFENETLTVKAERKRGVENTRFLRHEIRAGRLERSFHIGQPVKEEEIAANLSDGVLIVQVPKAVETPRSKVIEVK
jgi:HSP20 family protein